MSSKLIQPRLYFISDNAWTYLVEMAKHQKYIAPDAIRLQGISDFLCDLSHKKFTDTRPRHIIRRHENEIRNNRAPRWSTDYYRGTHLIKLDEHAIANYFRIAYQFGIIREEPYLMSRVSATKPIPVVGYVLEGIGLRWITPDTWPIAQHEIKSIPNERPQ